MQREPGRQEQITAIYIKMAIILGLGFWGVGGSLSEPRLSALWKGFFERAEPKHQVQPWHQRCCGLWWVTEVTDERVPPSREWSACLPKPRKLTFSVWFSLVLEQEQEQGGTWSQGKLLGCPIIPGGMHLCPFFCPRMDLCKHTPLWRNPLLGGAGHRGGRRLGPADGEKCWEEKKNPHLKMKAEVKVRSTGGAGRVCTIW